MLAVPGYHLQDCVYAGEHCWVYRALDQEAQRGVVLKILRPENLTAPRLRQLKHEFAIARLCNHHNIASALHMQQLGGYWLMVSEDIQGESLARRLDHGSAFVDLESFFDVALQLAAGLVALHAQKIIHRNINPANLVWSPSRGRLQIIDFGIAWQIGQEPQVPGAEQVLEGDLAYMAPEQTGRMNRALDNRCDFYAVGATLYHLLCGVPPFSAADALSLIHCHMAKQPDWSVPALQSLPPRLIAVLRKLLQKDPDLRYQEAAALLRDLAACRAGEGLARPLENESSSLFRAPQCLYGRAQEVAEIMGAFERAASGSCELLLLAGEPGIGKTALVNEVQRAMVARGAQFAAGKCDQFLRSTPYESLVRALRELIVQTSYRPSGETRAWFAELRDAVGSNAALAVGLFPELGQALGRFDKLADLPAAEARNRLSRLLQNLIQTFASAERPLVLFLDDLHWADVPTLQLLESVLLSPDHHHLLIIGAYRTNELTSDHGLNGVCLRLGRTARAPVTLHPAALSTAQVVDLIKDSLRAPTLDCEALAAICQSRTGGNPLFLLQLLKFLQQEHYLSFDYDQGHWRWNPLELASVGFSENVVELMVRQIRLLPAPTVELLQLAASLGHRVALEQIALIAGLSALDTQRELWPALQAGILLPESDSFRPSAEAAAAAGIAYRFMHDRVQQACYALATAAQRSRCHQRIGRMLLRSCPAGELDEQLLTIVEHLNAAVGLLATAAERLELAQLNLRAGRKKRQAGAYQSAADNFSLGRALLAEGGWSEHFRLVFELSCAEAETAYLLGDFARAQRIFAEVLGHCRHALDIVSCLTLKMQSLQLQGLNGEAIEAQRYALSLLGIDIPASDENLQPLLLEGMDELERAAACGQIESMLSGEQMRDTSTLAAIPLLFGMWFAAYVAGRPSLCALAAVKMIQLSLRHGVCDSTPMALANFALLEIILRQNPELAGAMGQLAVTLADKRDNLSSRANTKAMYAGLIAHWHYPMAVAIRHYDEAYDLALECGDYVIAGNIIPMRAADQIIRGHYLPDLLEDTEHLVARHVASGQFDLSDATEVGVLMPIRCLTGQLPNPERYDHQAFKEEDFLRRYQDSPLILAYYLHSKIRNAYLFDCQDAEALAARQGLVEEMILGQAKGPEAAFYAALIWIRALQRDPARADAPQLRARFEQMLARQEHWALLCADNHAAKALLLKAERARYRQEIGHAMRCYQEAIETAQKYGQIHLAALACEQYAEFLLSIDQARLARALLHDAARLYRQWGASAKAERLQAKQQLGLQPDSAAPGRPAGAERRPSNAVLDLDAIMQAAQALTREVGLHNVLDCLLTLVRNAAGAEVARLLLSSGGQWFLEAEICAEQRSLLQHRAVRLEDAQDPLLPLSLIRHVANGADSVIEDHLAQSPRYCQDPYVQAHQPLSVMCLPLRQTGQLRGLLYLENNQSKAVFGLERHHFLHTLAGQLLIAIDNARLHDELERKVAERTLALEELNHKLAELCMLDSLTAIPNRRSFNDVIEKELQRAKRDQLPLAVCLIDVDHFKAYNDHYGHLAGDDCLRQVAQALSSCLKRSGDFVARFGGEEFVVVLPVSDAERAAPVAQLLRQAVEALQIPHGASSTARSVTVSVGVACCEPDPWASVIGIINAADQALYLAKSRGRNQVAELPYLALRPD